MSVSHLRVRMRDWIQSEYTAVIFEKEQEPVAYALYREGDSEVYLRQLFVRRDCRRQGIGREAVTILRSKLWPLGKRYTVEVLTANSPAVEFWRSLGYRDYSLMLEITPD